MGLKAADYLRFQEGLARLGLGEEDLKRLISAGEIGAFRDGSVLRLRRTDVERVRKDLEITHEGYTLEEAREVLGMGADQLQHLVNSERLPSYRSGGVTYLGRFQVDRFLQESGRPPLRLSFDLGPANETIEGYVVPGDMHIYPTADQARSVAGEEPFFRISVWRMDGR